MTPVIFSCEGEFNFDLCRRGAVAAVFGGGFLQRGETLPGVVKIENRFREPFAGQIDEQLLKLAERAARLERLLRGLHRLERPQALDENKSAPAFARFRAVERTTVARGNDGERAARDVGGPGGLQLGPQMCRDAEDIVHHAVRVFEDGRVDFLVDVAHRHAALVVGGDVGFVDVADLARLGVENFPIDLKRQGNFEEVMFFKGGHENQAATAAASFGTSERIFAMIRSVVTPSASASKFKISRCRNAAVAPA